MDLANQLADIFTKGLSREGSRNLTEALSAVPEYYQPSIPTPEEKWTKAEANYEEASNDRSECGICHHFILSGRSTGSKCELVIGNINSHYTCDYFDSEPNKDINQRPKSKKPRVPTLAGKNDSPNFIALLIPKDSHAR